MADIWNVEDRADESKRGALIMNANESNFELTSVEIVLHEFNRAAIDKFLKANDIETDSDDWGKKIKQVLLLIERGQQHGENEKSLSGRN